jgi:hypothetical protein
MAVSLVEKVVGKKTIYFVCHPQGPRSPRENAAPNAVWSEWSWAEAVLGMVGDDMAEARQGGQAGRQAGRQAGNVVCAIRSKQVEYKTHLMNSVAALSKKAQLGFHGGPIKKGRQWGMKLCEGEFGSKSARGVGGEPLTVVLGLKRRWLWNAAAAATAKKNTKRRRRQLKASGTAALL